LESGTGCVTEGGSRIATGAMVFNGARAETAAEVEFNAVVYVNTVVPAGTAVPMGWFAGGHPARRYAQGLALHHRDHIVPGERHMLVPEDAQ
jgi:carbonic anhydrase/acetyltransferase-like protein (isoleucine patch superfamily)